MNPVVPIQVDLLQSLFLLLQLQTRLLLCLQLLLAGSSYENENDGNDWTSWTQLIGVQRDGNLVTSVGNCPLLLDKCPCLRYRRCYRTRFGCAELRGQEPRVHITISRDAIQAGNIARVFASTLCHHVVMPRYWTLLLLHLPPEVMPTLLNFASTFATGSDAMLLIFCFCTRHQKWSYTIGLLLLSLAIRSDATLLTFASALAIRSDATLLTFASTFVTSSDAMLLNSDATFVTSSNAMLLNFASTLCHQKWCYVIELLLLPLSPVVMPCYWTLLLPLSPVVMPCYWTLLLHLPPKVMPCYWTLLLHLPPVVMPCYLSLLLPLSAVVMPCYWTLLLHLPPKVMPCCHAIYLCFYICHQ